MLLCKFHPFPRTTFGRALCVSVGIAGGFVVIPMSAMMLGIVMSVVNVPIYETFNNSKLVSDSSIKIAINTCLMGIYTIGVIESINEIKNIVTILSKPNNITCCTIVKKSTYAALAPMFTFMTIYSMGEIYKNIKNQDQDQKYLQ